MEKNESPKSSTQESNTRWWESYLVRYFLGFAVGSMCVFLIGLNYGNNLDAIFGLGGGGYKVVDAIKKLKIESSVLLISISILGVCYCYVASTPITVMHHSRFRRNWFDGQSRYVWIGLIIAFCMLVLRGDFNAIRDCFEEFSLACALFFVLTFPYRDKPTFGGKILLRKKQASQHFQCLLINGVRKFLISRRLTWKRKGWLIFCHSIAWGVLIYSLFNTLFPYVGRSEDDRLTLYWLLSFPVFWIGIAQYFSVAKTIIHQGSLFDFYAKLFKARARRDARDVRDTYTHLREHSNAIFIVAIELSILSLAFAVREKIKADNLSNIFPYIIAGLLFWMIPTVFIWSRANAMELEFSNSDGKFS